MNTGLTLKKMLQEADKGGYAIPSFNYSDIWDLMAIIEAAEELKAPIMFAANQIVAGVFTPGVSGAMGVAFMNQASVPIIHHLDHSKHVDLCKKCIDNQYPSVMIDGSDHDLETNIKMVKEVMDYAKANGRWVHVEAEVGKIPGKGVEGFVSEEEKYLVEVKDVIELVKSTNVDSLAIGIGSQHGFYKGTPKLNIQRLDEVNAAVDTPLVLHGGSGIRLHPQRPERGGPGGAGPAAGHHLGLLQRSDLRHPASGGQHVGGAGPLALPAGPAGKVLWPAVGEGAAGSNPDTGGLSGAAPAALRKPAGPLRLP